jgi:hypothetical protein
MPIGSSKAVNRLYVLEWTIIGVLLVVVAVSSFRALHLNDDSSTQLVRVGTVCAHLIVGLFNNIRHSLEIQKSIPPTFSLHGVELKPYVLYQRMNIHHGVLPDELLPREVLDASTHVLSGSEFSQGVYRNLCTLDGESLRWSVFLDNGANPHDNHQYWYVGRKRTVEEHRAFLGRFPNGYDLPAINTAPLQQRHTLWTSMCAYINQDKPAKPSTPESIAERIHRQEHPTKVAKALFVSDPSTIDEMLSLYECYCVSYHEKHRRAHVYAHETPLTDPTVTDELLGLDKINMGVVREEIMGHVEKLDIAPSPTLGDGLLLTGSKFNWILMICEDKLKISEMFPCTMQELAKVPYLISASVAVMQPKTCIRWHRGFEEYGAHVTRCLMGIDVPERCALNTTLHCLEMQTGKTIHFNDWDHHEAWNLSLDKQRVVLIVDITDRDRLVRVPAKFENVIDPMLRDQLLDIRKTQRLTCP